MTSNSPDLPPLPQDPPEIQASIHSVLAPSGGSLTDTESYARSSRTRESIRSSSRGSGIYGEITRTFKKLQTQLLDEKRRADDAERRLAEVAAHLKAVNEARLKAMQDAAQAREDLRLYKIQLDHAQREIFRAQDAIAIVDRQRLSAEKEAAKNRSKARHLNETLLVQAAREEAWRVGLQEGLNRGRNITLAEFPDTTYGPGDNTLDEESSQESPDTEREDFPINVQSAASSVRSRAARESRAGPSNHEFSVIPSGPPTVPPTSRPQSRAQSVSYVEPIKPVSVQNMPSPRLPSTGLPIPDNFIPSLDADNRIRIPPAFEFSRTPERPASAPLPPEAERSMEALPIPPPEHSTSHYRRPHHRRTSSSDSSTLSALDIINEPFVGAVRTPMSAIPEVSSQYTDSPHRQYDGDFGLHHQPSFTGSFQQPPSGYTPGQFVSEQRPSSRTSFGLSHNNSFQEASNTSTPPGIAIQPPSRDGSFKADSLRSGARRGISSPASQIRVLPPNTGERSKPSSVRNGMPGGLTNVDLSTPTDLEPSTSQFTRTPWRFSSRLPGDDDTVSSALSAGTLTTPPGRYQNLGHEVRDAEGSASAMGRPPSMIDRHGSMNTAVYSAPDSASTEDMTGIGSARQTKRKKGKKK